VLVNYWDTRYVCARCMYDTGVMTLNIAFDGYNSTVDEQVCCGII